MKVQYDKKADAAFIRFSSKRLKNLFKLAVSKAAG
jgi:uncharacterized protein YuzE